MVHKACIFIIAALVVISGCTSTPEPTWACYTYNFVETNENSAGIAINIIKGTWVAGDGLRTDLNELVVNWQEEFYVNPRQIKFSISRVDAGDIDVLYEVNAFAYGFGGSNTLPAALPGADIDNTNPNLGSEGRTVNATMQTTGALYIRSMTVYTENPTPFPRNDCDTTPTNTPTNTPTGTWTATPTNTSTPIFTPGATPVCTTYTWGGGSIYPTEIDKFTGGSGEGWLSGSWGYGFYGRLGSTINVDVPDGYVKKFVVMNISNTGNPGIFSISVSGTQFNVPIAACAYSTFGFGHTCTFDINASVPGGIAAASIDVWGQRGTGEGANAAHRPFIWLRNVEFEVCSAPPSTATPSPTRTPSATNTPTNTRTPVGGTPSTPTNTGIAPPATGTATRTRTPSMTPVPPMATNTPPPPPPTTTPLPTSTPRATSTLIPVPTVVTPDPSAVFTSTAFATYGPPDLPPIPGTPDFDDVVTPGLGTLAGTPQPGETNIPRPDDLDDFHSGVVGNLGTAVAQVNALPRDLSVVLPSVDGMYSYVGQAKWLASGISLQEIFGLTVYPVPQHMFYGITAILFVSFIMISFRVVMWLIKLALWVIRFILKIIPFIG